MPRDAGWELGRPTPSPSRGRLGAQLRDLWSAGVLAVAFFVVAYENGGYGLTARAVVAIGLWWTIILGIGLGLFPRTRPPRAAIAVGALLAGFAFWSLASTIWAASAEDAFVEFDRNSLYLAVFVLAALAAGRHTVERWVDGLTIGIVAVALLSLVSRLFPHLFSTREVSAFLPNASARLSFPLGYWNGLAIFVGFGVPLCLRLGISAQTRAKRALAAAVVPVLVSVIYLASSRGGLGTAVLGAVVFLAASDRRWAALGTLVAAGAGSVVAVVVLASRHTLVNGPLSSPIASHQGRTAAVLLVVCCLLAGGIEVAGERLLDGRTPDPRAGKALVGGAIVFALVVVALAHPVRRFDAFTQVPAAEQAGTANFATAHLLSGNGSGRWQFWVSAIHEFTSAPLIGRGAGSFQFWWAQHASFTYSLKNAHSLYLEVLGELGLVGFALLVGALGVSVYAAAVRLRRARSDLRPTLAALAGVLAAFLAGAAIDWIWQLTVVGSVGILALGLLTGNATAGPGLSVSSRLGRPRRPSHIVIGIAALLCAWFLLCAEAAPWLASTRVSASQRAVRHGDLGGALSDALDAKTLEPWAASPYVQLALVEQKRGDLGNARRYISEAISRDSTDWTVWYVGWEIESASDQGSVARADYAKAASLDPRSPLFASRNG